MRVHKEKTYLFIVQLLEKDRRKDEISRPQQDAVRDSGEIQGLELIAGYGVLSSLSFLDHLW